MRVLGNMGGRKGRFRRLPFAGSWTAAPRPPRARKARRSRKCGPTARGDHERARRRSGKHPPLARRDGRGDRAQRHRRRPHAARAEGRHPLARATAAGRARGAVRQDGGEGVGNRRARRDLRAPYPQAVADYLRAHNLPANVRMGDDARARAPCPGARRSSASPTAHRTETTPLASAAPSPGSPRPAR